MFTSADLAAYLDEALPAEAMAAIEQALRADSSLSKQLAEIIGRRDSGIHALGEIWRRNRLSCPSRQELGSYLLEALADAHAAYISFHVQTVGCRFCQANLSDMRAQRAEAAEPVSRRRRKYFQSSAGHLQKVRR